MRLDSTTFSIGLALSHIDRSHTVTAQNAADIATEFGVSTSTVRAVARALRIDIAPKGAKISHSV